MIEPPTDPGRHRAGTTMMLAGTVVSALAAIVFQVVGGRALGAAAFAPVSVMWTLLFLGITIFLLPVEQLVIRRRILGGVGVFAGAGRVVISVLSGATLAGVVFTLIAADALLDGDRSYAWVAAGMFVGHGLFAVARGHLAGRHRFVAYGLAVGIDALVKLGGAIVVTALGGGPLALSWALAVSPIVVFLVRPFRGAGGGGRPGALGSEASFMTGFLISSAASQTVLAAGPLVVGALGAPSAAISVFFVTTTLFRGPLSASYNLVARILPVATARSLAGDDATLDRWVNRLLWSGLVLAAITGAAAAVLGPSVVELFYGSDFRPEWWLTGLAAAAVVAGMFGLGTTQMLVGRGHTGRMAIAWSVAVVVAGVVVAVTPGVPSLRVAAGFLSGELVAFFGLSVAALRR